MDEQQNKEKGQSGKRNYRKRLVLVLIILGCMGFLIAVCTSFIHQENARRVLKEATLIHLAIRTVGMEYYAMNKNIVNHKAFDGLADGVEEELYNLSGCGGKVYLDSWDVENLQPEHFIYSEGGFVVDYAYRAGKDIWNVYEMKHIIVH